jgi:uncharacterized protein (UPF0332 family)
MYAEEFRRLLGLKEEKFFIRESAETFKISLFVRKGTESLVMARHVRDSGLTGSDYWTITMSYYAMLYLAKAAILSKGYETDDHYATQVALGYLLVPDKLKKEDLLLLEQSHKIFEEDYVEYFADARRESRVSKYSAGKRYAAKRVDQVYENAKRFITKLLVVI